MIGWKSHCLRVHSSSSEIHNDNFPFLTLHLASMIPLINSETHELVLLATALLGPSLTLSTPCSSSILQLPSGNSSRHLQHDVISQTLLSKAATQHFLYSISRSRLYFDIASYSNVNALYQEAAVRGGINSIREGTSSHGNPDQTVEGPGEVSGSVTIDC